MQGWYVKNDVLLLQLKSLTVTLLNVLNKGLNTLLMGMSASTSSFRLTNLRYAKHVRHLLHTLLA
jgi:hypothetical protein